MKEALTPSKWQHLVVSYREGFENTTEEQEDHKQETILSGTVSGIKN